MARTIAIAIARLLIPFAMRLRLGRWAIVMFYRRRFDRGGVSMNDALAKHVPDGIRIDADVRYGIGPREALDVYRPERDWTSGRVLPVIVWVHGGGFLAGDKAQVANYAKIIACAGYVTVAVNYSLAPAARHPTPTRQVNAAIAYLVANSQRFNLDVGRVILAGDSAGAQIAAQLALALTDSSFADSIGVSPSIPAKSLRAVALYCGLYDPDSVNPRSAEDSFFQVVARSYLGARNMDGGQLPPQFSIVRNINPDMPPLFISAGNGDRLLAHSRTLAQAAADAGVPTETLFFPSDYSPPARHEYQFDLNSEAGRTALRRSLEFFASYCSLP